MTDRLTDESLIRSVLAGGYGPCVPFDGYIEPTTGYGRRRAFGRYMGAHRAAWIDAFGDPGSLLVRHLCGNRACVNLSHLRLGTHSDNHLDAVAHGTHYARMAGVTACKHGHEFTPENTAFRRDGSRRCRECSKERSHAYRSAK